MQAMAVTVDDTTLELAPVSQDRFAGVVVARPAIRPAPSTPRVVRPEPSARRGAASGRDVLREVAKRCFDVVLSLTLIVVLLPVLATIMLAIRATSAGPVFFRHQRLGRHGVPFRCWKFRTMHADADQRLRALLDRDARLRGEFDETRKLRRDPRITSVGRVLRRTSLDELPQLLNVLTGDMSIVGPRPIVDDETVLYGTSLWTVQRVRPGMTGLWQVSGRNDLPYDVRVRLDERYATTHTLAGDLKIIARTADAVVRGRGAY
jgi:exopolysaccharide production protein ExoY